MCPLCGADPIRLGSPPQSCLIASRNVVRIDEPLDLPLLRPNAATRICLVREDCSHRRVGPAAWISVGIASWVVSAGRRHSLLCQRLGDRSEPCAGGVEREDALDDGGRDWIRFKFVSALAGGGATRVWVRARVDELVPVRRSAAKEAVGPSCQIHHGRAGAHLDAVAFPLRHAAVQGHDQIMSLRAGVDGAANLGDPELNSLVCEYRKGSPNWFP